jgi:GNAT superfamily N-acetyltransferase
MDAANTSGLSPGAEPGAASAGSAGGSFTLARVALALALLTAGTGAGLMLPPPAVEPSDAFDGRKAQFYLEEVCRIGPRTTGSNGMRRQIAGIKKHFEKLGAKVEFQTFNIRQGSMRGRMVEGVNTVVTWKPEAKSRVLLSCHYDTRPWPDEERLPQNRRGTFIGANDGGSGVAFLMELGRLMPNLETEVGVDFVFFDAEELIFDPDQDQYFLGSKWFANNYARGKQKFRYDAVINLDMIADADLQIHPDQRSMGFSSKLVKEVWDIAKELEVKQFKQDTKHDVLDDHLSFHAVDVQAINLIDFDYPHWHKISDTPDKCSPESFDAVARVIVEWLKRRQPEQAEAVRPGKARKR